MIRLSLNQTETSKNWYWKRIHLSWHLFSKFQQCFKSSRLIQQQTSEISNSVPEHTTFKVSYYSASIQIQVKHCSFSLFSLRTQTISPKNQMLTEKVGGVLSLAARPPSSCSRELPVASLIFGRRRSLFSFHSHHFSHLVMQFSTLFRVVFLAVLAIVALAGRSNWMKQRA